MKDLWERMGPMLQAFAIVGAIIIVGMLILAWVGVPAS